MSDILNQTDTKPWYKQFWPWFIMAFPASAVMAGITTVVIAFKNADDLVVDDYYKEGKAINQRTELLNNAYTRGLNAKLNRLEGNFIHITFAKQKPEADSLTLDFIHPTDAQRDFSMSVKRQKDGSFQGLSPNPTAGRWYVRLSNPEQWLIKSELVATQASGALKATKI
ncbi:MAG: FixH family protein [Gammaproteobacteria bacterium]|jgi:hypothetical protein